ncbi:MAG: hypothetical protein HUU20_05540 [Pirellulales bacterium]|nr:hypothetical protein [Pirellulales bacterium]
MSRTLRIVWAALLLCVWIVGCGGNGASAPTARPVAGAGHDEHDHASEAEHVHPTEGPHGGHLIELGEEEYHAELLHDEATHTVTVHILDAAGKAPVPIPQDAVILQLFLDGKFVDYALKPVREAGTAGASEFAVQSEPATDTLLHAEKLQGRLRVTIGDRQYTGVIQHTSHAHEGHEHAAHE